MTSLHDQWVAAIDPRIKGYVERGLTDEEIVANVLKFDFPAITPRPAIPAFMATLNGRIAHWGEQYGRDAKGRRTYSNGIGQSSDPRDTVRATVRTLLKQAVQPDDLLPIVTNYFARNPVGLDEAEIARIVNETKPRAANLRDLADIAITPPIRPLAGILHPTELTIPFGTGGSGKGTLAAGLIVDLIHGYGLRVAVFDYEGHQREWVARIKTLYRHRYLADLPPRSILYIAPNGPDSGLPVGSFLDHADDLRRACETHGAEYAVLDSVAGGAVLGRDPKDDQTATLFATAWQRLSLPMMALSHIPKNSPTTDYPYGSAYWHNLARATWYVEQTGRLLNGFTSRLVNRKFNDADQQPSLIVEVEYTTDGWLSRVEIGPDNGQARYSTTSQTGIITSILAGRFGQPMTAQDVLDDWPTGSEAPEPDIVRRRLNELALAGTISRPTVGGGRRKASTYALVDPDDDAGAGSLGERTGPAGGALEGSEKPSKPDLGLLGSDKPGETEQEPGNVLEGTGRKGAGQS